MDNELWRITGLPLWPVWGRVVHREGEERRATIEPSYGEGWSWSVSYAELTCGVPYLGSAATLKAARAAADAGLERPPWWDNFDE